MKTIRAGLCIRPARYTIIANSTIPFPKYSLHRGEY